MGSLRRYNDEQQQQEQLEQAEKLEKRFRITALRAERGELYHLRATQQISGEAMEKLLYELDLMEKILIGDAQ